MLSLGRLDLPKKKWGELVELIEDALYGQRPIFEVNPKLFQIAERVARRIKRKERAKGFKEATKAEGVTVRPPAINLSDARELGTVYVGYEILKRLTMDKIF